MQIILYVLSLSPFFCLFVFCFRISWVTTNLINNYTGPSNAPESGKTTGERRAQLDRLLDTNKKIVTIVRIKAKLKWTNVDAFPTTTAATKCLTHTVETPRRVTRTKEETNKNAAPVYSIWHDTYSIRLLHSLTALLRPFDQWEKGGGNMYNSTNQMKTAADRPSSAHCHQNYEKLFFSLLFFFFLFFVLEREKGGCHHLHSQLHSRYTHSLCTVLL